MTSSIEKVHAALVQDAPLDVLRVGISACQGLLAALIDRAVPNPTTTEPTTTEPTPASLSNASTPTPTPTPTPANASASPSVGAATATTEPTAPPTAPPTTATTAPTAAQPAAPAPAPARSLGELPALVAFKAVSKQQLLDHVIAKLRGAQPATTQAAGLGSLSLDQVLDLGLAKLHSALAPPAAPPPSTPPRVEVLPAGAIPPGARVVHLTPARPHR